MSYDDGQWEYEDEPAYDEPGSTGGSRTGMYWTAGITVAVLSLLAGYLLGGDRSGDDTPAANVTTVTAQASRAAPSQTAGASSTSASESPSGSPSESPSGATKPDAELLAAMTGGGDIVLVDPDTGKAVRTLVPAAADGAGSDPSIAWDAARGVVYFTRAGCAIWRHRIDGGVTEQIGSGRRVAVSPDGTRLALWTCNPEPGQLAVMETGTGKVVLTLPLSTDAVDQGGGMSYLGDLDWRPDGKALVATEGWEGDDLQYLIDLAKLPKAVQKGAKVPVKGVNGSYHAAEYVGTRLVLAGTCCPPDAATAHVIVRDGKTGNATKLTHLSDIGFVRPTANAKGRIMYLRGSGDGPGALWSLDKLEGVPRELGGEFAAVDW